MADDYEELEWQCPKCTFLNSNLNRTCSMCEHENVKLTTGATNNNRPNNKLHKNNSNVNINSNNQRKRNDTNVNGASANNNNISSNAVPNGNSKYRNVLKSTLNSFSNDVKNLLNGINSTSTSTSKHNNNNNNHNNSAHPTNDGLDDSVIEIDAKTNKPTGSSSSTTKNGREKQWRCRMCTYGANPDWRKKCEICNNKRDDRENYNPAAGRRTKDEHDDDDDVKIYDSSLDENIYDYARIWTCKNCTYINFKKDDHCELCFTPKNTPSDSAKKHNNHLASPSSNKNIPNGRTVSTPGGRSSGEWKCEICSHKNKANTKVCELCANDVENLLRDEQYDNRPVDDDDDDVVQYDNFMRSRDDLNNSSNNNSDYYNFTMNPSLTYRSQRAMSTIKTYTNATNQAERIWRNIVKYCKEHSHKFIDDSFPPCDKSLFVNPARKPDNFANRPVQWLSPEHIRTSHTESGLKWTVYNEPKFNDIKQGLLGDCWLLSGLAVILEKPELLHKIIITKEFCPQGCYQVRLCNNGEWQTVILDDLFPCDANGYLLYSQASRKQLWVPLIEKAMAKLNGSYESLIAGQTVEGLSTLTGYPCDSIRLEKTSDNEEEIDLEMIWVRLLSMKEAGYALGASCGKTNIDDDGMFTSRGLLPRHAYSILNVKEVFGNQLIQLRNPWGRYTWTGDWSEGSSKWTPEIRKYLGLKPGRSERTQASSHRQDDNHYYNVGNGGKRGDEGVFWISFDDFVKYFCSIDICKARLDWFESRMSGEFNPEGTKEMQAYHLIVFETTEINIGLFHKTLKNRTENSDLDLCFAVLKTNGTRTSAGKLVVSSKRTIRKFIGIEHIFEPGEYLIVPFSFNFWYTFDARQDDAQKNNKYNLVIHSPKVFFLEQEMHSALLLADTVIELCVNLGTKTFTGLENACIYTLAKGYSGLIVVGENYNEKSYLHIELNCENSNNVVSTRQALLTRDSIPPLHRQVVILLTQLEGSSSYSIQYSIKYRLSSNPYLNTWPGNEGQYLTNMPEINKKTFGLHAPRSVFM